VRLSGDVIRKTLGKGSKSEHEAVYLLSERGEYVLRRQGGNPFHDPELDSFVGKRISCEGSIKDYVFLMTQWELRD
jgi:hypothetical protein